MRSQGVPSAAELHETIAGAVTVTVSGGRSGAGAIVTGGAASSARRPAGATAVRNGWYVPGEASTGDQTKVFSPCGKLRVTRSPLTTRVTVDPFDSQNRIGASSRKPSAGCG